MAAEQVTNQHRFRNASSPCPICEGYDSLKRGRGKRCSGFQIDDYVICTREEYAGQLEPLDTTPEGYKHKMHGPCKCGVEHNPSLHVAPERRSKNANQQNKPKVVAIYDYHDEQGQLVYQVVRYEDKSFRQRRPDGKGGFIWNLQGVTRLPYRLPELLKTPLDTPVYIPEGEKDAGNVAKLGLVSTTNSGGACNWSPDMNKYFQGRRVVLLADNDEKGRKHVQQVKQYLTGIAAQITVVDLAELPEKGDVSDWIAQGGTKEQLEKLSSQTLPEAKRVQAEEKKEQTKHIVLDRLCDLLQEELPEVRWAIEPILPEGVTILGGKVKLGKSLLALSILIAIALGGVALGQYPVEQGEVLYMDLENGKRRLQKRAKKMLQRAFTSQDFYYKTAWPRIDEGGLEELEHTLDEHPRMRAICIDTWGRFKPKPRGRNIAQYDEDYDAVQPLQELANRRGVTIIIVDHLRKMEADDPVDQISGSVGKAGAVDGFLLLYRKRGEVDARLAIIGRDIEEEQELILSFNRDWVSWTVKGSADDDTIATTPERQRILDLLAQHQDGLTCKEIAEKLGKNENTTRNQLADLRHTQQKIEYQNNRYSLTHSSSKDSKTSNTSKSSRDSNPSEDDHSGGKVTSRNASRLVTTSNPTSEPVEPYYDEFSPKVTSLTSRTTPMCCMHPDQPAVAQLMCEQCYQAFMQLKHEASSLAASINYASVTYQGKSFGGSEEQWAREIDGAKSDMQVQELIGAIRTYQHANKKASWR